MRELLPIETVPNDAVERLLDRAFGSDRHGRTAYRLRDGTGAIAGLSFALIRPVVGPVTGSVLGERIGTGTLLGTIQCWPVQHVGDDGVVTPLVLVGPVAVAPEHQRDGHGRQLMQAALAAADARSLDLMLIGDPEYYGRFFGFDAAATAAWRLPGPVERHRLLARGAGVPHGGGTIGARVGALARPLPAADASLVEAHADGAPS